jgi:hypothetical protein
VNRATDVTEKFFVRVDVTEAFPFLVSKMAPYYDRWCDEGKRTSIAAAIGDKEMSMKKNEMHRVPGFTAEKALEQDASTPYAGLALRGAGGGAVEPALSYGPPACVTHCSFWPGIGHVCINPCGPHPW